MLGPNGQSQMELGGGNGILSRANTRELVSRSQSAKTPAELKELGGRIKAMLDQQDRNKPEYVKDEYADGGPLPRPRLTAPQDTTAPKNIYRGGGVRTGVDPLPAQGINSSFVRKLVPDETEQFYDHALGGTTAITHVDPGVQNVLTGIAGKKDLQDGGFAKINYGKAQGSPVTTKLPGVFAAQ